MSGDRCPQIEILRRGTWVTERCVRDFSIDDGQGQLPVWELDLMMTIGFPDFVEMQVGYVRLADGRWVMATDGHGPARAQVRVWDDPLDSVPLADWRVAENTVKWLALAPSHKVKAWCSNRMKRR